MLHDPGRHDIFAVALTASAYTKRHSEMFPGIELPVTVHDLIQCGDASVLDPKLEEWMLGCGSDCGGDKADFSCSVSAKNN